MKILFTGASSFTGYWFVKTLAATGHEMVCTCTGELERYDGIRRQRIEKLKPLCRFEPQSPFGSENFLRLVREQNFDLLCHHGAETKDYKNPDFDVLRALESNTRNLRAVLAALKAAGLKGVVLTGSVFENDEGAGLPRQSDLSRRSAAETEATAGDEPLRAFSGYGLSKGLTWQTFQFYCGEAQIPLGKFVIPNPFGPFEEPRFTAYLMRTWKEGRPAGVQTPDYLRDNIHVDLMAAAYAKFLERVADLNSGAVKTNPSGYIEKQGEFAQRVAREIRQRLDWECKLELSRQKDFSEPLRRVNTEPVAPLFPNWSESRAWDAFTEFYAGQI